MHAAFYWVNVQLELARFMFVVATEAIVVSENVQNSSLTLLVHPHPAC